MKDQEEELLQADANRSGGGQGRRRSGLKKMATGEQEGFGQREERKEGQRFWHYIISELYSITETAVCGPKF